jgi:hypothetical protein
VTSPSSHLSLSFNANDGNKQSPLSLPPHTWWLHCHISDPWS